MEELRALGVLGESPVGNITRYDVCDATKTNRDTTDCSH